MSAWLKDYLIQRSGLPALRPYMRDRTMMLVRLQNGVSLLGAPGNVAGTSTYNAGAPYNTITWDAVAGTRVYKVFRDGVFIGSTTGLTYTDTGVVGSTAYTYTVKARNDAGDGTAGTIGVTAFGAPTDMNGYQFWFDDRLTGTSFGFRQTSAGNVACTNATTVGRINKSGGTEIATQATSALRPTYNTAVVGASHGGMTGNGTTQSLTLNSAVTFAGDVCIGVVFKTIAGNTVFLGNTSVLDSSGLTYDAGGKAFDLVDSGGNEDLVSDAGFPGSGVVAVAVISRIGSTITVKCNGVTASGSALTGSLIANQLDAAVGLAMFGAQPWAACAISNDPIATDPANLYDYLATAYL